MSSGHDQPDSVRPIETVLVVDNDAIMLKFMRKLLNEAGLDVVTAQDGLAALDLLTDIRPDLIFVDLVMPNIDGRALCRIIRSKPAFALTPITVISAIAAEEACDAADLGANVCIAKGTFADIAIQVKKLLDDPRLLTSNRMGGKILGINKIYPRRTTEELLDINRHYQIMLNSITNGILEVNANHRIIFGNPVALSIFSLTKEQLLGSHVDRLFDADAMRIVGRLLSDGRVEDEDGDTHTTVRGREIAVSAVSTQPFGDSWIIIMEDITEREQARTALLLANRELDAMAKSDGLTQIANRRYFDELLDREWRRMRREKGLLTIMLFDVDHFKDFNDNYGHLWGDQCLRDVAQLIKAALRRPSDQAARYGGDEFVAVLPNTTLEGATHLAKEIQRQVAQLAIRHEFSTVSDLVTLTIGSGCGSPHTGVSARELVSVADRALYAAKQQGRNCAVAKAWEPPPSVEIPKSVGRAEGD